MMILRLLLAICVALAVVRQVTSVTCVPEDAQHLREAFPVLYDAVWRNENATNCCVWTYITCSELSFPGRVDRIKIEDTPLAFALPSSIGNMTALEEFKLSNATLVTGSVPDFQSTREFILHIERTGLTGQVRTIPPNTTKIALMFSAITVNVTSFPCHAITSITMESVSFADPQFPDISACPRLRTFSARSMNFTGSLPPNLAAIPLESFTISNIMSLGGSFPAFNSILRQITVRRTNITGSLLENLVACCVGVEEITASETPVTGFIPNDIASLVNLTHLQVDRANLTGIIPVGLFQLPKLRRLYLGSNRLHGAVPRPLPSTLTEIGLQGNSNPSLGLQSSTILDDILDAPNLGLVFLDSQPAFNGTIPENITRLTRLERLFIGGCGFSGTIPESIGSVSNLSTLSMTSSDAITGPIPASLGQLSKLRRLHLDYMNLEGVLPDTLGNLFNLERFVVKGNPRLGGPFPDFVQNFSSLTELSLDQCNFTGPIPNFVSRMTKLKEIDLRDNRFTGCPEPFYFAQTSCDVSMNQFDQECNVSAICRVGQAVPPWVLSPPISSPPPVQPPISPPITPATSCVNNRCEIVCDASSNNNSSCVVTGSVEISNGATLVIPSSGVVITGNLSISNGATIQITLAAGANPQISVSQCLVLQSGTINVQVASGSTVSQLNNSILAEWDSRCSQVSQTLQVTSNVDVCRESVTPGLSQQASSTTRAQLYVVFSSASEQARSSCNGAAANDGLLLPIGAIIGIAIAATVIVAIVILVIVLRVKSLRHKAMPYEQRRREEQL